MLYLHKGEFKPAGGAHAAVIKKPGRTTVRRVELQELRMQLEASSRRETVHSYRVGRQISERL